MKHSTTPTRDRGPMATTPEQVRKSYLFWHWFRSRCRQHYIRRETWAKDIHEAMEQRKALQPQYEAQGFEFYLTEPADHGAF